MTKEIYEGMNIHQRLHAVKVGVDSISKQELDMAEIEVLRYIHFMIDVALREYDYART